MKYALRRIHAALKKYTPPDLSRKSWISYELYKIKVAYVSPPRGKLLLTPNRGLKWSINMKKYSMNAKLRVSKKITWFRVRKTYTLGIVFSNVKLGVIITPTKTKNGGLYLTATDCTSTIKVKIDTSSIILKIFSKIFKKRFEKQIKSKMCKFAVRTVNTHMAKKVSRFPVSIPIGAGYVFRYGLVSNPAFTSKYLLTRHEGSICKQNKKVKFPFAPKGLPVINNDNSMIYFVISDFVGNTLLYSSYLENRMKFKLKTDNKHSELFKTTCHKFKCIGSYLPKLSQTYPNSTIELFFSVYKPATIKFNPNHIHVDIAAQLDFFVVQLNGTRFKLVSSQMALYCVVKATMKQRTIMFTINDTRVTMGKMSSKLLHVYDRKKFEAVASFIIKMFTKELPDFPFPLVIPKNTLLSNQHLRIVKNAIIVSSNFKFK